MSSRFAVPANASYDDPLPFECVTDPNLAMSLVLYAIQAAYLLFGAVLNFLIVHTIFKSKKGVYRQNSFYLLYTADAIVGIYINLSELLIGRLFLFVTPLCPIVTPHFFTPSILFKFYYAAVHYSSGFKTVSQIFLSLNRMTCVIWPLKHVRIWRTVLKPVLVALFVLPFGVIWNILISRVYLNPNGAGFSVNYKDRIAWANVSLLHLGYSVVGFVLVVVTFIVTIVGLLMMERRVKDTERSLTVATLLMAVQMVLFVAIQIYFAFFAAATPSLRSVLLLSVVVIYDSMNVSSPVALILMSRQLRADVFHLKPDDTTAVASRSVSTVSHQQPPAFRAISSVVAPTVPL